MSQHSLQFQDVSGKSTVFVDPLNVNNTFVHKSEKVRKNIATIGRQSFYRNEFSQVRQYTVDGCGPNACGVKDDLHGRVILSGANETELVNNWSDLKANVDASIAAGALKGLRLPLNISSLKVTDAAIPAA